MNDSILLLTKFLIPHRNPSYVSRPSLASLFCQDDNRQIGMIVAPAGYGKTSLLVEAAEQFLHPVIWIQLDERDNDAATFMSYLIEGLHRQFNMFSLAGLLQTEDTITLDNMLIVLINHLLEQSYPAWMLIFDDYHVINNPIIHNLVSTLLENLPSQGRVVIASRVTPDLPLARWRARKKLLELRAQQLCFSAEETQQWLTNQSRLLPMHLVQKLVDKTEGWGAGLQLAFTLLNENDNKVDVIDQLMGTQPYIFDYLMYEVFAQQPDEIQLFLLKSSVFNELNPETCSEVLNLPDSQEIVGKLEKNSLFISRLDHQKQWYRYHQLFRDFLLSKFKILQPETYTQTQIAVGDYFAKSQQYEIAILHYLSAKQEIQAIEMLRQFAEYYLSQGRVDEIQNYLNAFSNETRAEIPYLRLLQGQINRHNGQFSLAIQRLEQLVSEDNEILILYHAYLELTAIRYSQGQYNLAYNLAQRAVDLGKQLDACDYVHALMAMANCASFLNGMAEARQLAEQAYSITQTHIQEFTIYDRAKLLQTLGQICWWHGDAQKAIHYCQQALKLIENAESPLCARLLITLSTPTLYQKNYEIALQFAEQAIVICKDLHLTEILPGAYAVFGNVLTRMGELEKAEKALTTAIHHAELMAGANYFRVMAIGYLAQNLALQGRLNEALQLAEQEMAIYEKQSTVYDVYVCRSVLADLLLDTGKSDEAKAIYLELTAIGEVTQYRIPLAMAYFGLSYIGLMEQENNQAVEYAQQSLALLEPAMMQQLYLDQHKRALVVCEQLVHYVPDNQFVQQVYQILSKTSEDSPRITFDTTTSSDLICIQTLGNFKVFRQGQEINPKIFASSKARDLLAYFVTIRTSSATIDKVIEAIWLDNSGSPSAFHTALYRVRKALRFDDEREKFILSEVGEYRLDIAKFDIDVDSFDHLFKHAKLLSDDEAILHYEKLLSLYQGDYLDNLYYDWLMVERERLHRDYLVAVTRYCDLLIASFQYQVANDWLRKILKLEPYNETFHIQYMKTFYHMGQHREIKVHYQLLTELLSDNLATEPMPATKEIYQRLTQST